MSERKYLILSVKHSPGWDAAALWWGASRSGYYSALEAAGRYTEAEAKEICFGTRGDAVAVLETDAIKLASSVVEYNGDLKNLAKIGATK
ncbi:MAG: hypothetical protein GY838_13020 [bacterium]|nr:hypothetical protein [bacterium]